MTTKQVAKSANTKAATRCIRGPVTTPIKDIIEYDRNAKQHTDASLAALKASIMEFGYSMPVLIDERGVLLAGHGRVKAAKLAGMSAVPALIVEGWSDIEKREYRLLDNRSAELSMWDEASLQSALAALADHEFNFDAIGFAPPPADNSQPDDSDHGDSEGEPDDGEDEAPPRSTEGDIWVLGQHRLVCGDSTNAVVVAAVLDGRLPRLMVTDPPYGVEYDDAWRMKAFGNKVARGKIPNDDTADWSAAVKHFTGPSAYVWYSNRTSAAASLTGNGFDIDSNIVWQKNRMTMGMGWMHWEHEACLYAERHDAPNELKAVWHGGDGHDGLWLVNRLTSMPGHPSIKPLELMALPIKNSSSKGDIIYDPFAGSGTTIIAAEGGGRICCAVEINPRFVDVAIDRWEASGGDKAVKL